MREGKIHTKRALFVSVKSACSLSPSGTRERDTPASVAPLSSSSSSSVYFFLNFRARSLSLVERKKEMGGGGFYGGKGPTKRSASSSMTTKTPLEIAREEDALEAELGYHVPPADDGGEQKLGWLVNASAVRFRRRLRRRRLSFCALKGNFGIIISLERARERRDWKNSKITSISLRARARATSSLSLSPLVLRDPRRRLADETPCAFSLPLSISLRFLLATIRNRRPWSANNRKSHTQR